MRTGDLERGMFIMLVRTTYFSGHVHVCRADAFLADSDDTVMDRLWLWIWSLFIELS